jgi:CSLREA domain-containing protein
MKKSVSVFILTLALLCSASSIHAAVYIVTKTADTNDGTCGDADCSLREAIAAANATADNDIIVFALPLFSSPQTITLSGSELVMTNNGALTVAGPGANRLTISGNNTSRIFRSADATVTLSGMRLTGGNGVSSVNNNSGGAILNDAGNMTLLDLIVTNNTTTGSAGGIRNSGTGSLMSINRCVITSNTSATSSAGGLQNFSTSALTVLNSTFAGNISGGGTVGGGAMQANGMVSISNSTFVGNTSNTNGGGGAINSNGSLLLLTNVTITGNASNGNGGGLHRGTTNANGFIRNSIIARNNGAAASPDVTNSAGGLASQGNNILGAVGTSTGWVGSDLLTFTDGLTPFGFHGGFGMTQIPFPGSAPLNAGQNCVLDLTCTANNPPTALTFDQRGAPRPVGSAVDIGAVEAAPDYVAILPSAVSGVPYDFLMMPSPVGFTYILNSGSFGGLNLVAGASLLLQGTASTPGRFDSVVQTLQTTGPPFSTTQRYRINVFADPNANVSVSGRMLTSTGEPVSNAYVSLVGYDGRRFLGLTNPFGYFRLDGIPPGLAGSLVVNKKGLIFAPVSITVSDVIENLEIRALP